MIRAYCEVLFISLYCSSFLVYGKLHLNGNGGRHGDGRKFRVLALGPAYKHGQAFPPKPPIIRPVNVEITFGETSYYPFQSSKLTLSMSTTQTVNGGMNSNRI